MLDLGGVVVRIARTWRERVLAAGVQPRDTERGEQALQACWDGMNALQRGELDTPQLAEQLAAHMNGLYTPDEVTRILNAQLLGPYPGVAELVSQLRYPHAIFSNTSADHWRELSQYDAVKRAQWPIASFQIGHIKPQPGAYRRFEAEVGRAGEELLFFDDSAANVHAARDAGWHAERIDPFADVAQQLRRHLRELDLLAG